jgi:ferrous iron transport protein A
MMVTRNALYENGSDVLRLDDLEIGIKSKIIAVHGQGPLRNRLLDMGLTPKTEVMIQRVAPMGDPIGLKLRGYELTLRLDDVRNIEVEDIA